MKTQTTIKKLIMILGCLLGQSLFSQQIYVNREWRYEVGDPVFNPLLAPYGADWSKSIVSPSDNALITVGHTFVSGQGENILLTRFRDDGMILWQTDFNSGSTFNDYGIDLIEASNGDIYVCGVSDNGGITNYDVVILVFDDSGNLQYSTTFDGPDNLNDIPSSIKIDSYGNLIIGGTSESASTLTDYMILSYDPSLSLNWNNTYDYTNLQDVGAAVEIDAGKIHVAGASANSVTDWDMTVASFDESTGAFIADSRVSYPGIGHDQVLSFRKDLYGNTYITGKASSNGTNFNIRTAKIDFNNTLVWAQSYDAFGHEDVGNTIAIDGNGDVIVGGFITKTNNIKDLIVLKYNGSNGNLIWKHTQSSNDGNADALVKALTLNNDDVIYFIAGEKEIGGNKRALVGRLEPDGTKNWEKTIRGNYDFLPSDIQYGGFGALGIYAIAIKDSTINSYEMNFFTEHKLDTSMLYTSNNEQIFPKRQLIIRFDSSALIMNCIDNSDLLFGNIEQFVKPSVVQGIREAVQEACNSDRCEVKVFKIFPEIKSYHLKTISRLGDSIEIPQMHLVLLLEFENNIDIINAANSIQNLFPTIKYCHPNYVCVLTESMLTNCNSNKYSLVENTVNINSFSNDSLYPLQAHLHSTSSFTNGHINSEEAWELESGKRYVKIGVFDSGAFWKHKEFMDSTETITKINGWDFIASTTLTNDPIGEGLNHGTQVTGIIAANRNNAKGIAGIASGNFKQNYYLDSSGVSVYAMRIFSSNGHFLNSSLLNYLADAIVNSAIDDPSANSYKYGLNIMNNSWRIGNANSYVMQFMTDTNITLLREAVHFANRAKVTFVAAAGNEGNSMPNYPAIIDDDWVLTVGGTGNNGGYYDDPFNASSIKNNIDVAAPASSDIIYTTGWTSEYFQACCTSLASPHVSSAAGLLMSYHNKPYPDPSNLAPEDIEFILEKSATDVGGLGYDDSTGHGRLNLGKALKFIQKPNKKILHFSTDNSSQSYNKAFWPTPDTIKLTERYKNASGTWFLPNQKYVVYRWVVNTYVNYSLPSASTTILYVWPRHSSSNLLESISVANKTLRPRERVSHSSPNLTQNYVPMSGYIYKVLDTLGNPLGWWPFDTTSSNFNLELSMLIKDTAYDVNISEKQLLKPEIKVYPNPTNYNQTIEISSQNDTKCNINLHDVLGRTVLRMENVSLHKGLNKLNIPISGQPPGVYFYTIKTINQMYYLKILKN